MAARRLIGVLLYPCKQELMMPGKYLGPGNTKQLMGEIAYIKDK